MHQNPSPNKIAIVKLSSLGDIIHTIPAFNLLRKYYPDSEITWFSEPPGAQLLSNFSGIDRIEILDLKKRSFLQKMGSIKNLSRKHGRKFDISLDFQGLIKSALLSFIIGKNRYGFSKKNLRESISSIFYTKQADHFNESDHVIKKNINLLRLLNIEDEKITYPVKKLDESDILKRFFLKNKIGNKDFIILNIGAGWQSKLLTSEQYIEMIGVLNPLHKTVVLWGNKEEEQRAEHIVNMTGAIKAPFLNFSDLIMFIRKANVLISSDSLALHIADMVRTGSVGIFGPTSPERNGPLNQNKLIIYSELECSNCYKRYCSNKKCLKDPNLTKIKEFVSLQGETRRTS